MKGLLSALVVCHMMDIRRLDGEPMVHWMTELGKSWIQWGKGIYDRFSGIVHRRDGHSSKKMHRGQSGIEQVSLVVTAVVESILDPSSNNNTISSEGRIREIE